MFTLITIFILEKKRKKRYCLQYLTLNYATLSGLIPVDVLKGFSQRVFSYITHINMCIIYDFIPKTSIKCFIRILKC